MEREYTIKALSVMLETSLDETKIEIKRLIDEKILEKDGTIYRIVNTAKGTEFIRNQIIKMESRIMNMGGTIPPSDSDKGPGFT